ncbi:MAG: alpha/beta fold hydrolase [Ktedonobacteraceae bacterium]|nr:alpha/beta fold hydrolase [Ktedonobacteraceae bacterium]
MKTCVLFIQGGGQGAHVEDGVLAKSLEHALGSEFEVRYPHMLGESEPDFSVWTQQISSMLAEIEGDVILVGHSLGGAALLNYLAENTCERSIAGLFLLAAPSWDKDKWNFDELKLPRNVSERLAAIDPIFFYQCCDDEVVPFEHLALHEAQFPNATTRVLSSGGHQFCNGLQLVAEDIQNSTNSSGVRSHHK